MKKIKEPNVAGSFYPSNPIELDLKINECLISSIKTDKSHTAIKAMIVPHAGYTYSGPVAASAYIALEHLEEKPETIVILSPTHYFSFEGIALTDSDEFQTPLGNIEINQERQKTLSELSQVFIQPKAFEKEHALEVHLPFLQKTLGTFKLIPAIISQVSETVIREFIEKLDDGKTLFIVSSDLSHFHNYKEAKIIDQNTCQNILNKNTSKIKIEDACGFFPLKGILSWAKNKGLNIEKIDLRNSGDISGEKSSVVGYGSFLIY